MEEPRRGWPDRRRPAAFPSATAASSSETALLQDFLATVHHESRGPDPTFPSAKLLLPRLLPVLGLDPAASVSQAFHKARARLDARPRQDPSPSTLPRSHGTTPKHSRRTLGRSEAQPRSSSYSREPRPPALPAQPSSQPSSQRPQPWPAGAWAGELQGLASPYHVLSKPSRRTGGGSDSSQTNTDTSTLVEDPKVKAVKSRWKQETRRSREVSSSRYRQRPDKENRSSAATRDGAAVLAQKLESLALRDARDDDPLGNLDQKLDLDEEEEETSRRNNNNKLHADWFQSITSKTSLTPSLAGAPPSLPPPPLPSCSLQSRRPPQDPSPTPSDRAALPPPLPSSPFPPVPRPSTSASSAQPPPALPPRTPQGLPPGTSQSAAEGSPASPTDVVFSINEEATPFVTPWRRSREELTLAGFKQHVLPAKYRDGAQWRYFFTCLWDGQEVHREISDPHQRLPLAQDGRLRARILPRS